MAILRLRSSGLAPRRIIQQPKRRFRNRGTRPTLCLGHDHPAVINGTPLFPTRVRSASAAEWVLKGGEHSKKLGSHFSRGPWRGLPIFSLTLPERATCPRSCKVWHECFGNGMPHAVRFLVNTALYTKLIVELDALSVAYPKGFTVRLHVLGDFVDTRYVQFWLDSVKAHRGLHIFGFTAWARDSEVGALIERQSSNWDRFRIRFSGDAGPRGATITDPPAWGWTDDGFVCPAQAHRSEISCGSCGYCIKSTDPVVFVRH